MCPSACLRASALKAQNAETPSPQRYAEGPTSFPPILSLMMPSWMPDFFIKDIQDGQDVFVLS